MKWIPLLETDTSILNNSSQFFQTSTWCTCILPYFGRRKQVTYHPNLSYWYFHNSHNELFFQAKFHAETLILLRDMLDKTSWYFIDISVNNSHILLFYEKCNSSFCQSRAMLLQVKKFITMMNLPRPTYFWKVGAGCESARKALWRHNSLLQGDKKWGQIVNRTEANQTERRAES